MQKKYKILVSAYACSPNQGSEPGMGWNFVVGLSRYHEVHVITEKIKWERDIELILKMNPVLKQNLKVYFIEKKRRKKLRKIWPPSYYWYYKTWQKKAYKLAVELDKKQSFDLFHQLNMVGYREPGYLWKFKRPFVWGPIGGMENSPWRFLPSLGIRGFVFYTFRNIINLYQRYFSRRVTSAFGSNNARFLAASPEIKRIIVKTWKVDSEILTEVGQEELVHTFLAAKRSSSEEPLKIVWSGQHTSGKNLPLLLYALCKADFLYELHVLGKGPMTNNWKILAKKLGVDKFIIWYGWLEKQVAMDIMNVGHVFCITSISDMTSTVTLEALSYGLPIVCLDHCGFSHVVTEECGIKIPVDNPKKAADNFLKALKRLFNDEGKRQELSYGALNRALNYSWSNKIEKVNKMYNELMNVE